MHIGELHGCRDQIPQRPSLESRFRARAADLAPLSDRMDADQVDGERADDDGMLTPAAAAPLRN
jgi:hypothetical protein